MHPRALLTLEHLDENEWFTQVGLKGDIADARILSSWQEAIDHCSLIEWQNTRLEAANQYRERILKVSKERFVSWNEIAREVRKVAIPFASRKIQSVVRENNLPAVFGQAVEWDVIHVCMEAEYTDVVPPGFYSGLCYWYTVGHFQCGWEGGFPGGRPIIY